MQRIFTIAAALLMTASVWAQAPEKMSYQALVRDASDALITNQAVGMQISILQGSATGTAVYEETQTPSTNANGLVSLEIGTGTVVSGDFSTIDWANDTYFIKTETDPTGGTTYTITGTSQLMSVPYALHAKTAESVTGTISYTETDPVFGASIANGITALDTANWNNHIIDTDTQLDSTDIANLGYNSGGITTEVDGSVTNEIQDLQLSGNNLTITNNGTATTIDLSPFLDNTDTQLDSTDIANLGYNSGGITTEVDGSVTNEIQSISRTGTTVSLSNGGGSFTDSVGVYTAGTGIDITNNVISTTGSSPTYTLGLNAALGGYVFYVTTDGKHGLVAETQDQSTSNIWWTVQDIISNPANHSVDGQKFSDWRIPNQFELNEMYLQKVAIGGFANSSYWSSTELVSDAFAYRQNFFNGFQSTSYKRSTHYVRAVRAF
jgi:hypothetical protein